MKKEDFELEGKVENKVLRDKNLVYKGGELSVDKCDFVNCDFTVRGAAADGVNFMKALFHSGCKRTVMRTFLSEQEYEVVRDALGWEGEDETKGERV